MIDIAQFKGKKRNSNVILMQPCYFYFNKFQLRTKLNLLSYCSV